MSNMSRECFGLAVDPDKRYLYVKIPLFTPEYGDLYSDESTGEMPSLVGVEDEYGRALRYTIDRSYKGKDFDIGDVAVDMSLMTDLWFKEFCLSNRIPYVVLKK